MLIKILVTVPGKYTKLYDSHWGTHWQIESGALSVYLNDKILKSYAPGMWLEVEAK